MMLTLSGYFIDAAGSYVDLWAYSVVPRTVALNAQTLKVYFYEFSLVFALSDFSVKSILAV